MAKIKLTNGRLRVGNEIIVMGPKDSETYFHQTIKSIILDGKDVKITAPAKVEAPIVVKVELSKPVQGGDSIFIFTDKTYRHRKSKRRRRRKSDYYRLS